MIQMDQVFTSASIDGVAGDTSVKKGVARLE